MWFTMWVGVNFIWPRFSGRKPSSNYILGSSQYTHKMLSGVQLKRQLWDSLMSARKNNNKQNNKQDSHSVNAFLIYFLLTFLLSYYFRFHFKDVKMINSADFKLAYRLLCTADWRPTCGRSCSSSLLPHNLCQPACRRPAPPLYANRPRYPEINNPVMSGQC